MKAKVYWETQKSAGETVVTNESCSFEQWCGNIAEANRQGTGFLTTSTASLPLKFIVRIEKLED